VKKKYIFSAFQSAPTDKRVKEGGRILMKGLRVYRVVHVDHPWQFYVQYPQDENYAGIGVAEMSTFQAYYDSVGEKAEHLMVCWNFWNQLFISLLKIYPVTLHNAINIVCKKLSSCLGKVAHFYTCYY